MEHEIFELMKLLATNPKLAADELDVLALRLQQIARQLRNQTTPEEGFRNPGAIGDRIKVAVVGPNGKIKQTVDTGN